METSLRLVEDCEEGELVRALELLGGGYTPYKAAAFLSGIPEQFNKEFEGWVGMEFVHILGPHINKCYSLARAGKVEEILREDLELFLLPEESEVGSITNGNRLFDLSKGAKSAAVLESIRKVVAEGDSPGHLATAVAVRGAAFNFPLQQCLLGYVAIEWRAGHLGRHLKEELPGYGDFLSIVPRVAHSVRAVLAEAAGPFATVAP
jgi:hypothetical protein